VLQAWWLVADGSRYYAQISDQTGRALDLPPEERKVLVSDICQTVSPSASLSSCLCLSLWLSICLSAVFNLCAISSYRYKGNVDLYSAYTLHVSNVLRYSTHCQEISQFYLHTLCFIRKQNEPHLPLPFPVWDVSFVLFILFY